MCNVAADTMNKLEKTVRQFLEEGRLFTGYDVTIETRTRERIKLRHEDCRGAIHEMQFLTDAVEFGFDLNGQTVRWAKTQAPVGHGQWAFVYHPANVDPSGYTPRQVSAPNPVASSASAAPAPTIPDGQTDSGGQNTDGTFSTDYRNRLFIQTRFLRDLGLKAGDDVHIVPDGNSKKLTLVADPAPFQNTGLRLGSQRVERNGDLRLSSATLGCASLTTSKFKIETTTQHSVAVVEITEI